MSAYIKGLIVSLIVAGGCLLWYLKNQDLLPVNQSPATYRTLDLMEKDGVPDFALQKIGGGDARLSDYRDKIVIVNFWASWCNPCVEEFPSMMKLVEKFGGSVVILAVTSEESRADIETFMKAFGLPKPNFEVLWDSDKDLTQRFGVEKVPESFLIGKDGRLIRKVMGISDWNTPDAIEYFKSLL